MYGLLHDDDGDILDVDEKLAIVMSTPVRFQDKEYLPELSEGLVSRQ